MRKLLAGAALIAIAGCGKAPGGSEPNGPVGSGAGRSIEGNAAQTAPIAPQHAGDLPDPSTPLRFIGNWATDQRACASAAWKFTETTLQTPAGADCSFNRVTQVPGGYDIEATCTAEAAPTSDTLQIRFAESAKAMLFDSKTIADTGLVSSLSPNAVLLIWVRPVRLALAMTWNLTSMVSPVGVA